MAYYFQPISTAHVSSIRPNDKDKQMFVSEKYHPELIKAGFVHDEIINRKLVNSNASYGAGTHDGIRDGSSDRVQWGWEYTSIA